MDYVAFKKLGYQLIDGIVVLIDTIAEKLNYQGRVSIRITSNTKRPSNTLIKVNQMKLLKQFQIK